MVSKITSVDNVSQIRIFAGKKTIVLVSGCFDLFHIGHLRFLEEAKVCGDILVVGVLADEFVKQRKGETRPIFHEKERAELLAALEIVDYIVIFNQGQVERLIENLNPRVYVIGGDRKGEKISEKPILEKHQVMIKYAKKYGLDSTTKLIQKIKHLIAN